MLDFLARHASDFGLGGGDEAKRAAMRRAAMAFGSRLLAGAQTEGFGALGAAAGMGMGAYGEGLEAEATRRQKEAELARDAERQRVQDDYTKALTGQVGASDRQRQEEMGAKLQQRAEEVARRRAAIARLPEGQRDRLEAVVDSDQFDDHYMKATEAQDPAKPITATVGRSLVEFDRESGTWRPVFTAPAEPRTGGAGGGPGQIKPGDDLEIRGNEMIQWIPDGMGGYTFRSVYKFSGTGADTKPQARAMAKDIFDAAIENWKAKEPPDPVKVMAEAYRQADRIITGKGVDVPGAAGTRLPPPGPRAGKPTKPAPGPTMLQRLEGMLRDLPGGAPSTKKPAAPARRDPSTSRPARPVAPAGARPVPSAPAANPSRTAAVREDPAELLDIKDMVAEIGRGPAKAVLLKSGKSPAEAERLLNAARR